MDRPRITSREVTDTRRPLDREDTRPLARTAAAPPAERAERSAPPAHAPAEAEETQGSYNDGSFDPDEIERELQAKRQANPNYLRGKAATGAPSNVPEGVYEAILVTIREKTIDAVSRFDPEETIQERWEWVFQIVKEDPDYAGETITGLTTRSYHDKSTAYKWGCELMGKTYQVGEEVDYLKCIGKVCQIKVTLNQKGYPKLDNVLRLPTRGRAA